MMTTERNLSVELETYEKNRDHLIAQDGIGKFVLIKGNGIFGVWDTYEDALKAGYLKFGVDTPFVVKKIEGIEGVQFISRSITCQI